MKSKKIDINTTTVEIFERFNIKKPLLLGKGDEGSVYEYEDKAIKIYSHTPDTQYLKELKKFQNELEKNSFTFETPQIYEIGNENGTFYTIEKRLKGVQMNKAIIEMNTHDRQVLYRSYYNAIKQVNAVSFSNLPYGQIIKTEESMNSECWTDYLIQTLDFKKTKMLLNTKSQIPNFDKKLELFKNLTQKYLQTNQKQLVHCDYYLTNVLVDKTNVSAVLDFSGHTSVGDPKLDIASVLTWNMIDPNVKEEDYKFLFDIAKKDFGDNIEMYADLYLLYSGFYFTDMNDPSFSIKILNNEKLWEKYDIDL